MSLAVLEAAAASSGECSSQSAAGGQILIFTGGVAARGGWGACADVGVELWKCY